MSSITDTNQNRVAGGLKATLNNPNMSDETKSNAQDRLDGIGASMETSGAGHSTPGEMTKQQLGGYKATMANDQVSDEAKGHARDILQSADNGEIGIIEAGNDKNINSVLGGHKATLKNPNVSEEAKNNARNVLREHGEKYD